MSHRFLTEGLLDSPRWPDSQLIAWEGGGSNSFEAAKVVTGPSEE